MLENLIKTGIISNGLDKNILKFQTTNLRDFGIGNYKQTDDAPYGGGPGMVMMVEPLDNAILNNKADINVFLTPSGSKLDEKTIKTFGVEFQIDAPDEKPIRTGNEPHVKTIDKLVKKYS